MGTMPQPNLTPSPWNSQCPRTLVIACSDGRLQENLDNFLHHGLGIAHYDRLYAPGGPGALAASGFDHFRAEVFRRECRFLLHAHSIQELILIFHGPAEGGPQEATCADYQRKLPGASASRIRQQQEQDANAVKAINWGIEVQTRVFRCEVTAANTVQFVPV